MREEGGGESESGECAEGGEEGGGDGEGKVEG